MQATHGLEGVHIGAEYTPEQLAFMRALDAYKRSSHHPYLSPAEILLVARSCGYRLVAAPVELPVYRQT